MASSSILNLLSSCADLKVLFNTAAKVKHTSEIQFLETVGQKGRQSLEESFTILKVSSIEDSKDSKRRIINNVSVEEYAIGEIDIATRAHDFVLPMAIYQFAALNKLGCLLNNRNGFSTTGRVLVVVLSFVLIQLWKQGYTDITSISIVVGNVLENRQDGEGGLLEENHVDFWPFSFSKKANYKLGELPNDREHSDAFFSLACRNIIGQFRNNDASVTFLTAKATSAARANGVIQPLKDQTTPSEAHVYGHLSNRRSPGRDNTQSFSSTILSFMGAKKPSRCQGLNYWHFDKASALQSFSSTITITVSPLRGATTFTWQIGSLNLLGSYEETGGGAESQKRMNQRIATARAKREKQEREARERAEKRRLEKEKKEEKRRLEKEKKEEKRRLEKEKKEEKRRLEEETKRLEEIEEEAIKAAKLEFRIDTEKFSDTHDPEIIEALEEASGDLDTIDQELATLVANTEGLNHKENSEKCEKLETVRRKILYRFSELLTVVDENTRQELGKMNKKRAREREEERKKKKTSSLFDLL